jgi:rare lipoprotein A
MFAPRALRGYLLATALPALSEDGMASTYGRDSGNKVACGGELNASALTAAHKAFPCGARVRVTNKGNGRSVVVTINDRGPFVHGRVIDLTPAAAGAIGQRRRPRLLAIRGIAGSRRRRVPVNACWTMLRSTSNRPSRL